MKRIASACLYQTLHFILDLNLPHEEALRRVEEEVEEYKKNASDRYQVIEEEKKEDGTFILKVKKRVSGYPIGDYFKNK